jgi:SpoVK/Ycf46/Vps4 family AAA+-type ATPase
VLDTLAECFHFSEQQISSSVETGCNMAFYRGEIPQASHVFEAARGVTGHDLRSLTCKVTPTHSWEDVVLPAGPTSQLREICRRVSKRHHVLGKWGFESKLSSGKGVCALFHGYSGTGKTMAAEVIARALELDLYKIDLAGVVSKYIGETEKNLDRIFDAAERANGILFFDEADALFGKRSEVRDSHDRYANLEISYLLQKMEQYEGVAILATNLRQNLDDAFLRRLTFVVPFPFPEVTDRQRIWERIWPQQTPLAADIDPAFLANRFLLSGGNIRNVALAAAYLAVEEGGPVALAHVLQAIRAEFQKMGKTLSPAELMAPPLGEGAAA